MISVSDHHGHPRALVSPAATRLIKLFVNNQFSKQIPLKYYMSNIEILMSNIMDRCYPVS